MLLLAGCTESGVIYYRDFDSTSLSQAAQHVRGSEVTLVVMGNPFGGDQAVFEQFVADTIHGANPGTAASFNPTPADVAVQVRLRAPALLEQKHAEHFLLQRRRTFEYFQSPDGVDTKYRASHQNLFPTLLDLMGVPAASRVIQYERSLLVATEEDSQPRSFFGVDLGTTHSRINFD